MTSKNTGARPKTKGRNVPSRYRQAAEKVASQSSSDDSVFESREVSRHSGNSSMDTSTFKRPTSTPMPGSLGREIKFPSLDESVLDTSKKETVSTAAADELTAEVAKLQKKKGKKNMKALEEEIDLLYASYLQSAYLESEAKSALKARGANILEQIHKLVVLFSTKLDILAKLDCTVSIISSMNEIFVLCQKQDELLTPILDKIPELDEKLRNLSEAVQSVKHKLPVKDVELPVPSEEKDLSCEIKNMCHMLKSFLDSMSQHQDMMSTLSNYKNYVDLMELLSVEMKRTLELILRARQLQIEDTYLKVNNNMNEYVLI